MPSTRACADGWHVFVESPRARACLRFGFDRLGLDEIASSTVPANLHSRALVERLDMRENSGGDFAHPALAPDHRLARHLPYRLRRADFFGPA